MHNSTTAHVALTQAAERAASEAQALRSFGVPSRCVRKHRNIFARIWAFIF